MLQSASIITMMSPLAPLKPARRAAPLARSHLVGPHLLRRLLAGEDAPLRPATRDLPPWLRRGAAGDAFLLGLTAATALAWRVGDLPVIRPFARRVRRALS